MKFFVLALVLHQVNCSGIFKCPKQAPMQDFDINQFTGRWYEVERTFHLWELYTKCLRLDVAIRKSGQINLTTVTIDRFSGKQNLIDSVGTQTKKEPSIYQVRVQTFLPKSVDRFVPGSANYQVLFTDYDNFAIVWACTSYGIFHQDRLWILGRNWDISVDARAKIYHFLSSRNIDTDRLLISGKDCARHFF